MLTEEENNAPRLILTEDGSHSLFLPHLNETYHSRHGAMQESKHVFIENGLKILKEKDTIHILEVGFGTGLNALLSFDFAKKNDVKIHYTTLETSPLPAEIYQSLNYAESENQNVFISLHQAEWNTDEPIGSHFTLHKKEIEIQKFSSDKKFDLIFYDAFGPPTQPEMWSLEIFESIVSMMTKEGVFVTYCAKGQVRRDLESCGLKMERLPGPPGKREMLRGRMPNG